MTAATEKTASREAPFRADMRGDKLRIALKYKRFLPGGSGTGDAHKMATASVWFLDLSPPRHCVTGLQVHTILAISIQRRSSRKYQRARLLRFCAAIRVPVGRCSGNGWSI